MAEKQKKRPYFAQDFHIIVEVIAKYFDVDKQGVLEPKNRWKTLVHARHCVMYFCRHLYPTVTMLEISEMLHCDHTGIHYGLKQIKKKIEENRQVRADVKAIEELLKEKNLDYSPISQQAHDFSRLRKVAAIAWEEFKLVRYVTKDDFVSFIDFCYKKELKQNG